MLSRSRFNPLRAGLPRCPHRIVLASNSPRRKELLRMVMGCDADADADAFDVVGSAFDEKLEKSGFAGGGAYAEETAYQKAADVASRLKTTAQKRKCLSVLGDQAYESLLVLGCDTVVEVDGTILEKPADARHATEMLELLRGNVHQVHTGVALIHLKQAPGQDEGVVVEANMSRFYETTDVTFDASIPDDVLDDYVQSGEPMDKAGSYGIQGSAGSFVEGIKGCYFNVMGLPLNRLSKEIIQIV